MELATYGTYISNTFRQLLSCIQEFISPLPGPQVISRIARLLAEAVGTFYSILIAAIQKCSPFNGLIYARGNKVNFYDCQQQQLNQLRHQHQRQRQK